MDAAGQFHIRFSSQLRVFSLSIHQRLDECTDGQGTCNVIHKEGRKSLIHALLAMIK